MKARPNHRIVYPLVLILLLAAGAALAGCGGGGGDSTASTATTEAHPGATSTTTSASKEARPGGESNGSGAASTEPGPPASAFVPRHHHDSGGGSAQFMVKGGDNSVQEFGTEASESELEQAATALHGFLDARAEHNWAAACSYLSKSSKQGFAQLSAASKQPQSCAATLAALSGKVPTSTLAEAAQANVGSLRLEGDRAFVIYRGADNTIYAISMAREGGSWKVASLAGTPLG